MAGNDSQQMLSVCLKTQNRPDKFLLSGRLRYYNSYQHEIQFCVANEALYSLKKRFLTIYRQILPESYNG
ncbi:hypothetical protein FACS1894191_3040 [Clostridia bacterium]|nr:hypothetical protein FACS1894191_3040 [Clostridia bacterium]